MRGSLLACVAGLGLVAGVARADVIGFSNLTGATGDAFPSPYTEAGFTVTVGSGAWYEEHLNGRPRPSLGSRATAASLIVTGGTFNVTSLYLAVGPREAVAYEFVGTLRGAAVFDTTGIIAADESGTPLSGSGATIDRLVISFTQAPSLFFIDNIVVTPAAVAAPEPGTIALLGLGLLGLGAARRQRSSR